MQPSTRNPPLASQHGVEGFPTETPEAAWRPLYRVGGAAALLAAGLELVAALIGVISSATAGPTPSTVIGWYTLLQHNRFLGLVDLGLFDIVALVLLVPIVLAVSMALRRASASMMAIATTLYLVGIGVYLATETAFNVLSLSDQYAAATTDALRALLEAAGQAMLADQVGAGAGTYMGFVLVGMASLIIAMVMLPEHQLWQDDRWSGPSGQWHLVSALPGLSRRVHPTCDRCPALLGLRPALPSMVHPDWPTALHACARQLGRGGAAAYRCRDK